MNVLGKDSFLFYRDWKQGLKDLPAKIKLELYDAIVDFALDGEISALSPEANMIFSFIKPKIERDKKKYIDIMEKRSRAGRESAKKKAVPAETSDVSTSKQIQQMSTLVEDNVNDNVSVNDNGNVNDNSINIESISKDIDSLSPDLILDGEGIFKTCIDVINFYNEAMRGSLIVKCRTLTEKRRKAIKNRLHEFKAEGVREAIRRAAKSKFLNGSNNRNWKADFDFIFNANKMAMILEGKYDDNPNEGIDSEKTRRAYDIARRIKELESSG